LYDLGSDLEGKIQVGFKSEDFSKKKEREKGGIFLATKMGELF
jgi:hypothetical protein